jgi:AraC family transcriptional regulator
MPAKTPLFVDYPQISEASHFLCPRPPLLSSARVGWKGIFMEYHRQPPYETPEFCTPMHGAILTTKPAAVTKVQHKIDDLIDHSASATGDIVVVPAQSVFSNYWEAPSDTEFILLGLEPTLVAQTIDAAATPEQIELVPHFPTPDPLIHQMGLALKNVLASAGADSGLYAETMATALAVHLLQHYSTKPPCVRSYTDGLSPKQLRQVRSYIYAYIDRDLRLEALAATVQMSRCYFSTLFKQSTGLTPHQYVLQCRIAKAKGLLAHPDLPIADICLQIGFKSQSHFTNVFHKQTGLTPNAYRLQKQQALHIS